MTEHKALSAFEQAELQEEVAELKSALAAAGDEITEMRKSMTGARSIIEELQGKVLHFTWVNAVLSAKLSKLENKS